MSWRDQVVPFPFQWMLVLLVLSVAGCPAPPHAAAPSGGTLVDRCGQGSAEACERAMLTAPRSKLEGLVEAYGELDGKAPWGELYRALRKRPERPVALGWGREAAGHLAGVALRALPPAPQAVSRADLLLAIGRAAGAVHLLLHDETGYTHLFPLDVMAPHELGLAATVAVDRAAVASEIEAARTIRHAWHAAGRFAYVEAASEVDHLRAIRAALRADSEMTLRLRRALDLLRVAGIALSPPPSADDSTAQAPKPPPLPERTSSAYADLLVVQLTKPLPEPQWRRRRGRIVRGLSADRVAWLDYLYGKRHACPPTTPPPTQRAGDLLVASSLGHMLDLGGVPAHPGRGGRLALAQWLPRYAKLIDLVDQSATGWAFIGALLAQRGELNGLSAEGTNSYRRVTAMAMAHVAALAKLAQAYPARVQTLDAVALAYPRGVLGDRRLRDAVRDLLRKNVALKIAAARQPAAVFEAAAAAFAAGSSYPEQMRVAQLGALHQALASKLDGRFGDGPGWGIAGLHAVRAIIGLLTGGKSDLESAGRRVATALSAADVPRPALARLAVSTARYAVLAAGHGLDAKVANPAMFHADRQRARQALRKAITGLATPPPTSPAERELLSELTALIDGLVAAVAARLGDTAHAARCHGGGGVGPDDPLRDAFERLRKHRRTLLALPAFESPESVWARRAGLLALLASDTIDLVDQRSGKIAFAVAEAPADRIARQGLRGWLDGDLSDLLTNSYLFARSVLGGHHGARRAALHAATALGALSRLFDEHAGAAGSLFAALAKLGMGRSAVPDFAVLSRLLVKRAAGAYRGGRPQQGDVMLMLALGISIARDESVTAKAIELARKHQRPVLLPLVMHARKLRDSGDPEDFAAALRGAVGQRCVAPDPHAVITVRRAMFDFRQGRRARALEDLEHLLADAARTGIDVPRQIYHYRQVAGDKVFSLEQSLSMGGDLLHHAGSLQLGFGVQSQGASGGELRVHFADAAGREATREAARYYAHGAGLTAVYHFVEGQDAAAVAAARRAIDAWAHGVRLGDHRIPVGGESKTWAADARAVIAIAAQLAAERGMPLLAGDLWTLLLLSFDDDADDDAIAAVIDPLPRSLRDIPELEPVLARLRTTLPIIGGKLACTSRSPAAAKLARVRCDRYPLALSLRIADVIPSLPRLRQGAERGEPRCQAWRKLDLFLAAADERRYEPDKLTAAVEALAASKHPHAAAILLTRQRHAEHCSPALLRQARALSGHRELGDGLRADLLSVAVNCSPGPSIEADLVALDELTARQPMPTRNFEVLAFATRLAVDKGRYGPLQAIASRPGFMNRWLEVGPDLATAALLVQHAAAVGAGKPAATRRGLPFYRLLCTTFPPKHRGPMCDAVALLRGGGSEADKKRAAKAALRRFLTQATAAVRP